MDAPETRRALLDPHQHPAAAVGGERRIGGREDAGVRLLQGDDSLDMTDRLPQPPEDLPVFPGLVLQGFGDFSKIIDQFGPPGIPREKLGGAFRLRLEQGVRFLQPVKFYPGCVFFELFQGSVGGVHGVSDVVQHLTGDIGHAGFVRGVEELTA